MVVNLEVNLVVLNLFSASLTVKLTSISNITHYPEVILNLGVGAGVRKVTESPREHV